MRLEQWSAPRGLNDRFAPTLVCPARLNLLIVFQRGAGLVRSAFQSRFSLKRCHRSLCASAIVALPASVFGPVESPPWNLHRRLPGMTLFLQREPDLVRALHCGRSRAGRALPSSSNPFSRIRAHTTPRHSSHDRLKSGCRFCFAGQGRQRKRHASISSSSMRRSSASIALMAACSLVGLPIENLNICQQVCKSPWARFA